MDKMQYVARGFAHASRGGYAPENINDCAALGLADEIESSPELIAIKAAFGKLIEDVRPRRLALRLEETFNNAWLTASDTAGTIVFGRDDDSKSSVAA